MKVEMTYKKETPGTYVYQEVEKGEQPKIPTLYIRKSAFPNKTPDTSITVTVVPTEE